MELTKDLIYRYLSTMLSLFFCSVVTAYNGVAIDLSWSQIFVYFQK